MAIEKYIKSRADFVEIEGEIDLIMRRASSVSDALKYRRHRLTFTGTETSLPDTGDNLAGGEVINQADWLSAEQIMQHLSRWHKARAQVKADWAALSQDQQSALKPPPEAATGNPKRY